MYFCIHNIYLEGQDGRVDQGGQGGKEAAIFLWTMWVSNKNLVKDGESKEKNF